jgi:hypothetical protein
MDIANTYYSEAFQTGPVYVPDAVTAEVAVLDGPDGVPRPGILFDGAGLKPNFAYQVKLEGKPSYFYPDGNDWANEQIGYAGRWWLTVINLRTGDVIDEWNSSDSEYEYWKVRNFKDARKKRLYVFQGYLLFGFFVTDPAGTIVDGEGNPGAAVMVDSSLHVLWKESQRLPQANDTASVDHLVRAAADLYAYDRVIPETVESVYGEWEPTRPVPGQLVLPDGEYTLRLVITEESFHNDLGDGADPLGGFWQTVLAADSLSFTLGTAPPPQPELGSLAGTVTIGGKPARKVPVVLLQNGVPVRSTTTNPKGSYQINDLEFGAYEIECDGIPAGTVQIDGDVLLDIQL